MNRGHNLPFLKNIIKYDSREEDKQEHNTALSSSTIAGFQLLG
jgi:hypothetical protein